MPLKKSHAARQDFGHTPWRLAARQAAIRARAPEPDATERDELSP
jgi:hypothetical protein